MSRCFPYPPPGYERRRKNDDDDGVGVLLPLPVLLDESIKLQRESEKTKKEKKREKKERKEKKKEKKSRADCELESKKHSHNKRHKDEKRGNVNQKGKDHPKIREDETEQLEKSGLTEEYGQPSNIHNLCDSSDSSQDSRKRKNHLSTPIVGHNLGTVLRFRLPLSKHKDLEVPVPPSQVQSCSTSGRPEIVSEKNMDTSARSVSSHQPCSTSGRTTEILVQDKAAHAVAAATSCSAASKKPLSKEGSQYSNLIENWIPPPLQTECTDFDDQEWLFNTKPRSDRQETAKRFKSSNEEVAVWPGRRRGGSSTSALWPSAYYLAEADIYALPYTVPY